MKKLMCAFCLLLAVTACGPDENDRILYAATYSCKDGSRLFVRFKPASAWVDIGNGQTLALPLKEKQNDDALYASEQHEFRAKENTATWGMYRRTPTKCKKNI